MNKKKLNIVLIPSAIAVWIIVLYRVFSITGTSAEQKDLRALSKTIDSSFVSRDTLKLLLNYRDPFEKGNILPKSNIGIADAEKQFPKLKEYKIPDIQYLGLIDKDKMESGIALTLIDNHSFLLSKGDTTMGLRITALTPDSLIIEYHDKLFTISKTQQNKL